MMSPVWNGGAWRKRECIHYAGAGPGVTCRAGHVVEGLRDAERRLPCVAIGPAGAAGVCGIVSCPDRAWPPLEAPAPKGRMAEAFEKMTAGCCPQCGVPVDGEREVGGKIISFPCGHVLRSKPPEPRTAPPRSPPREPGPGARRGRGRSRGPRPAPAPAGPRLTPEQQARDDLGFDRAIGLTVAAVKDRQKYLAMAFHPDRGGSLAKMQAVNAAADLLIRQLTRGG